MSVRFRIISETERGVPSYFSRVRSITSPLLPKRSLAQFFPLLNPPRRPRCFSRRPERATQFISVTRIRGRGERGFIAIIQRTKGKREKESAGTCLLATRHHLFFSLTTTPSYNLRDAGVARYFAA